MLEPDELRELAISGESYVPAKYSKPSRLLCAIVVWKQIHGQRHGRSLSLTRTQSNETDRAGVVCLQLRDSRGTVRCKGSWGLTRISLSSPAFIMMMQTANLAELNYLTFRFLLRATAVRCVFVERQV